MVVVYPVNQVRTVCLRSPFLNGSWAGWPQGKLAGSLEGGRQAAAVTLGRVDVRPQVVAHVLTHLISMGQ